MSEKPVIDVVLRIITIAMVTFFAVIIIVSVVTRGGEESATASQDPGDRRFCQIVSEQRARYQAAQNLPNEAARARAEDEAANAMIARLSETYGGDAFNRIRGKVQRLDDNWIDDKLTLEVVTECGAVLRMGGLEGDPRLLALREGQPVWLNGKFQFHEETGTISELSLTQAGMMEEPEFPAILSEIFGQAASFTISKKTQKSPRQKVQESIDRYVVLADSPVVSVQVESIADGKLQATARTYQDKDNWHLVEHMTGPFALKLSELAAAQGADTIAVDVLGGEPKGEPFKFGQAFRQGSGQVLFMLEAEFDAAFAECRKNIDCMGERHAVEAGAACRGAIENSMPAGVEARWTSTLADMFKHYQWPNQGPGYRVQYFGDQLFVVKSGAAIKAVYSCTYDAEIDTVTDMRSTGQT